MTRRLARNALTLFLLTLTVSSGVVGLITHPTPNDVVTPFPQWTRIVWYAGLVLGGLISLTGLVVGGAHGLYVKRAGLTILAGWSVAVGVGAMGFPHNALGWVGSGTVTAFGLCCAIRAWSIRGEARERALLEHIGGAE